jgi:CHAP domain
MRILHLTTPRMKGDDVKHAQYLLRTNKFGKFYGGELDAVFGELTAQATHRAKYWLGYRKEDINKAFGPTVHDYLKGDVALPYANRLRRRSRLAAQAAAVKPLRQKALDVAKTQIGYHEGANNNTKYGVWFGMNYSPWCAMFVSYCYVKAGSTSFKAGSRWASVPYILYNARMGYNNLTITHDPKPGDLVLFQWDSGNADHVGLFEKWVNSTTFTSIEGNVGDQVARKTRYKSNVIAFVHVGR